MYKIKCKQCNKLLETRDKRQIYCGRYCYYNAKTVITKRICKICNTEFRTNNKYRDKKTCSKKCADKLRSEYSHNKEARKKISDKMKGRIFTKSHRKNLSQSMLGKTHSKEVRIKMSNARKKYYKNGGKHPMKGRKMTKKEIERMKEYLKGKVLKGKDHPFYGRKLSKEQKEKISKSLRGRYTGKDNPAWRGGYTKLENKIRSSRYYSQWRKSVFKRDNFTCIECGDDSGGNLNADHYPVSFAEILYSNNIKSLENARKCSAFWDIENGRTLCVDCHKKTDNFGAKYNGSK